MTGPLVAPIGSVQKLRSWINSDDLEDRADEWGIPPTLVRMAMPSLRAKIGTVLDDLDDHQADEAISALIVWLAGLLSDKCATKHAGSDWTPGACSWRDPQIGVKDALQWYRAGFDG